MSKKPEGPSDRAEMIFIGTLIAANALYLLAVPL
jgi:hypothetical protein